MRLGLFGRRQWREVLSRLVLRHAAGARTVPGQYVAGSLCAHHTDHVIVPVCAYELTIVACVCLERCHRFVLPPGRHGADSVPAGLVLAGRSVGVFGAGVALSRGVLQEPDRHSVSQLHDGRVLSGVCECPHAVPGWQVLESNGGYFGERLRLVFGTRHILRLRSHNAGCLSCRQLLFAPVWHGCELCVLCTDAVPSWCVY